MFDPKELALTRLTQEATSMMADQGISQEILDPNVVILATNPGRLVRDAGHEATIIAFSLDLLADELRSAEMGATEASNAPGESPQTQSREELKAAATAGQAVLNMSGDIAASARRRDMAVGCVAGLAFGALLLGGIGKIHYEFEQELQRESGHAQNGQQPRVLGDQIIKGNVLVWDSSILPGNTGRHIPVIGALLGRIPGVPDFGPVKIVSTQLADRTVSERKVVLKDSYRSGTVVNPVSYNLQLTGKEYDLGHKAAVKLFSHVGDPHKFDIQSIGVTGQVSDEFRGILGKSDPEQDQLAVDRAKVTAQAVEDEAKTLGIHSPATAVIKGHETVLRPHQISLVNRAAAKLKISTEALLGLYDKDALTSLSAKRLLNRYLGRHRGEDIVIKGDARKTELVKVTKSVSADGDETIPQDIPGEAFLGFGLWVGFIGGLAVSVREHYRFVQKRARKIARKAGLEV